MKCKVDFMELKKGIMKLGKAGKAIKKVSGLALIKIEAKENSLELSVNGNNFGAKVSVPAEVRTQGSFVSTLSSINILTLRNCTGVANIETVSEKSLVITYKNDCIKNVLTAVSDGFADIDEVDDDATKISLPLISLKGMLKNVLPFIDDSTSSNMHAIKMDISEDVDGLIKLEMSSCDVKSIALRTSYSIKNGNYTGSQVFLPEQIKIALDMINEEEENVDVYVTANKIFIIGGDTKVCFSVVNKAFPDIKQILALKNCSFSITVDKADIVEALNCILYVQNEIATSKSSEDKNKLAVSLYVDKDSSKLVVGCSGVASYKETMDVVINGELPEEPVYFNTSMLKEIINNYPNSEVVIGGSALNRPFWFCCGDNNEFVFAAMPKKVNI